VIESNIWASASFGERVLFLTGEETDQQLEQRANQDKKGLLYYLGHSESEMESEEFDDWAKMVTTKPNYCY
jgi:hypothetical protein